MSKNTKIEWCDSTINLQMGCQGCELWNPKTGVTACYAGQLTRRWAGKPGWPAVFEKPQVFMARLSQALRWPDLTGTERPDKPWLNGLPRLIFLNDLGDTFTEGLPLDWLAPAIEEMAETPHRWLILTKRPKRMVAFFTQYGRVPANFWLLTSVTDQPTWDARLPELLKIRQLAPNITLGVSMEPLLGPVNLHANGAVGVVRCQECGQLAWNDIEATECPWCGQMSDTRHWNINWVIAGGESGPAARVMPTAWAESIRTTCDRADTPFFMKQLGGRINKGGDWAGLPPALQVRQMPHA